MWFQTEVQTEIERRKEEEIKINEKSERAKRKEEERVKIVQQLDVDKLNILHTEVINYFQ